MIRLRKKKKPEKKDSSKLINTPEHQKTIRNRIGLIIFLTILIGVLLSFDFYKREFQNWNTIDKNLNIFLLININVILLVTVTLLLLRNLIKLFYERKKRLLGFKLKSKLTFAFILVAVLPMIIFFAITNRFLTNSLNFWFQGQYSVVLKSAAIVVKNFSENWGRGLTHYGNVVVLDLLKEKIPPNGEEEWFQSKLFRYRLDGIIIYDKSLTPQNKWFSGKKKAELWTPIDKVTLQKGISSSLLRFDQKVKDGHIYRAIVPVKFREHTTYLEVVRILPGSWYSDLETVRKRLGEYENLLLLEDPIRTNYTTYLLLIAILIIFTSTWFGYYLARNIVVPIETLVDGTRRIAKGDLDFQIELKSDDEIGMLLKSFNIMTKDLKLGRQQLAESQKELIDSHQALEERNIFVELVVQNIQPGVLSIDNSGFVHTVNPYIMNLFDIKSAKTRKKHYRTLLNKEQLSFFNELDDLLTNSSEKLVKKDFHLTQGKKKIHLSMQLFQLKNHLEEPMGKLLVVEDMTELDRSTRARAWREVARRIAHEIKNPLTPIQLSAQRIRRKYLDEIESFELLDSCTTTIINEVDGLKKMVNEFSKFARMPEINPSPMNINRVLQEVYDLFKPGILSTIGLEMSIDPKTPDTLLDAEQMKRVFTNLMDNAISAMEGEGKIELISSYFKHLKMVVVHVKDNGCGIPSHIVNRIFDPYVTSKSEGTGLGLAIVQQIVSDHGGFVRLSENKPQGTIFTIELPV
ncbi:MAG: two-component system nitrogen regulation sensor histidine kinase NtrY [bacterium]|jgi:two-component system nitrogen regulation sensor histidine kinase NtrY